MHIAGIYTSNISKNQYNLSLKVTLFREIKKLVSLVNCSDKNILLKLRYQEHI